MAKLPMNISKFKKIHDAEDHAILQHPSGHEIKIAKKPLDPKFRAQLAALPLHKADGGAVGGPVYANSSNQSASLKEGTKKHASIGYYAEGGEVAQQEEAPKAHAGAPININIGAQPTAPQVTPEQFNQNLANAQQAANPQQPVSFNPANALPSIGTDQPATPSPAQVAGQALQPPPQASAPATAQDMALNTQPKLPGEESGKVYRPEEKMPTGAPAQPEDMFGTQKTMETFEKGLGSTQAGIAQGAKAQGALGSKQAALENQAVEELHKVSADYQTNLNDIRQKRTDLQHDINNSHIDPQRYINNMSTGSQIMSAIGMVLSGVGGGGGKNLAAEHLNNMINRDIDAQKAELGKKENLLAINLKEEGNLKDAMEMTRMQIKDMVAHQLNAAAGTMAGPLAKANALKEIGNIEMTNAQQMGQMAARKALLGQVQGMGTSGKQMTPEVMARMVGAFVPKEEQKEAFKELNDLRSVSDFRQKTLEGYDRIAELQTLKNRLGHPIDSKAEMNKIVQSLVPELSKATAGRYTEQDAKVLEGLMETSLTQGPKSIAAGRHQIENLFSREMEKSKSVLQGYGMPVNQVAQFNSQKGQAPVQYKVVNGVKYMRGPNGEAIPVKE